MEQLQDVMDQRSDSTQSYFHGYLEDYLRELELDDNMKEVFSEIVSEDPSIKIIVDYRYSINREVIANQIIRYKDAFKVPKRAWVCPYLLYGKTQGENDFAVVITSSNEEDYLIAKGIYYSLTEQGAIFADYRNNLVAMSSDPNELTLERFMQLIHQEKTIGAIQRELDAMHFKNNEELLEKAQNNAKAIKDKAVEVMVESSNKQAIIYQTITSWFLLKKMVYVQTMMDKDLLFQLDNDIKKLRHQAKQNVDSLLFIPLSEMWRL
jgi:hypothetical protein